MLWEAHFAICCVPCRAVRYRLRVFENAFQTVWETYEMFTVFQKGSKMIQHVDICWGFWYLQSVCRNSSVVRESPFFSLSFNVRYFCCCLYNELSFSEYMWSPFHLYGVLFRMGENVLKCGKRRSKLWNILERRFLVKPAHVSQSSNLHISHTEYCLMMIFGYVASLEVSHNTTVGIFAIFKTFWEIYVNWNRCSENFHIVTIDASLFLILIFVIAFFKIKVSFKIRRFSFIS